MEEKKALRRRFRDLRKSISEQERRRFSSIIAKKILGTEICRRAQVVMAYASTAAEVELDEFLGETLQLGKRLAVPYICGDGLMEAAEILDTAELAPGFCGIRTVSRARSVIPPEDIDLIIVPGLAFTSEGARLGQGGGYYDRYLTTTNAYRLAVAFDVQITHHLPRNKWDAKVDAIATEKQFYICRNHRKAII